MRLLLLLLPLTLFATSLKEKFATARVGDFMVTEQNKTYTLLRIHHKTDTTIQLEEVSIPTHKAKKINWRRWLAQGAPGNTSWIMYECDLTSGELTQAYSHTRSAHLALDTNDSFLSTLYSLQLDSIPPARRKKIGPPPASGEADFRKTWVPPKVVDGKTIKHFDFDVMGTTWPRDSSDISGKRIELYFDKTFPFPYWLHVTDGTHTFKMRAIDSGRELDSPQKELPKRLPEFLGGITPVGADLRFTVKGPYKSYTLFAIDLTTSPQRSFSLSPKTTYEAPHCYLDIDADELMANCIRGHTYLFYAAPHEQPELLIESPQTYLHN